MTKDELITKQQMEIENFRLEKIQNKETIRKLKGKFFNIGQPLNDNRLKFDKAQMGWCFEVIGLIEELE